MAEPEKEREVRKQQTLTLYTHTAYRKLTQPRSSLFHTVRLISGLQSRYGLPNMDFGALVSMFPDLEHEFVDSATSDECIADLVCHLKREAADHGAVHTMDW